MSAQQRQRSAATAEIEPLQTLTRTSSTPVGAWKDSPWDCCRYGCCHASLWTAICCRLLAAAQVAQRLQLDHCGRPTTKQISSVVFRKLLWLIVVFWTTRVLLLLIIALLDPNIHSPPGVHIEPPSAYIFFCLLDDLLAFLFFAYSVVFLRNLRSHVRAQSAIVEAPGQDACCAMCCGPCVAAQLLRQTADYDTDRGRCCTATGLPVSAAVV